MCPYQGANFTLKITTADKSGIVASTSVVRSFNNSTPFEMQLMFFPLAKQRTYSIILHAASAIGLSEQEATVTIGKSLPPLSFPLPLLSPLPSNPNYSFPLIPLHSHICIHRKTCYTFMFTRHTQGRKK